MIFGLKKDHDYITIMSMTGYSDIKSLIESVSVENGNLKRFKLNFTPILLNLNNL